LGKDGPDARSRYTQLLLELQENGGRPAISPQDLTVEELLAAFWIDAQERFRREDGKPAGVLFNYQAVMKRLRAAYANSPAADFKALRLIAFRDQMIRNGLARTTINTNIHLARAIWRWGVSREMVPADVYVSLHSVKGLEKGRYGLRDNPRVVPVPIEHVNAIKDHVSRQVWALIQVQLSSGARAGEIVGLRACDLNMAADVWSFTPSQHKSDRYHGRRILIGPRGQEAIRPFLANRSLDHPLFSPADAEAERQADRHAKRVTPKNQGNAPGTNRKRKPQWAPAAAYTPDSYRRCINRACVKAGVPIWKPHQIRHLVATLVRGEAGIEVTATVLGHSDIRMAEVYAERDEQRARTVIAKLG